MKRTYQGIHRRRRPLYQRLLMRSSATLAIATSLACPPLAAGTAHATSASSCATATSAAATLTCSEQVFATAVDAVKSAQQAPAGAGVPLPGPIVGQTSLINLVYKTAADAAQLTENCMTQTDPTCALIVTVASQEAQAVETMATTCVNGTNAGCNQLKNLTSGEISALLTLANQCVGGQDATCNDLLATVSQLVGEAVTCASSMGATAPSMLPNPLVIHDSGGGNGAPDLTVTCEQVKNAAAQLTTGCASGNTPGCDLAIQEVAKSPCLNTSDEVPCAESAASPPGEVPPDVDPGTVFPANQLTGTIDTGSGVGVGGLEVNFYVDPAGADTFSPTPDLLGSTTTDSNGRYFFTLPTTLDAFATSQANANGGHLHVLITATAYLTIPGTENVSLAIAEGVTTIRAGGSADYFNSLPPTLTLYPAHSIDIGDVPAPPEVDVTDPSVPAETHYQGTLGSGGTVTTVNGVVSDFNPFLINGVDFTNATAAPAGTAADQPPPPDGDNQNTVCTKEDGRPQFVDQRRTRHNDRIWTIVGEIHAFWDQHVGFTYASVSDTTVQVGVSIDAAHWGVSGSANIHNSNSNDWHTLNNGPYFAHLMRMKFLFDQIQQEWTCQYNRDKTYFVYIEEPTANTWVGDANGADVSRYDGGQKYAYSNPKYRFVLARGTGNSYGRGKGYGYGGAFSVGGFSGGASTEKTNTVTVTQDALNKTAGEHDIWGNNTAPKDGAQIIYSY